MSDVYWRVVSFAICVLWFIIAMMYRRWWLRAEDEIGRLQEKCIRLLQESGNAEKAGGGQ